MHAAVTSFGVLSTVVYVVLGLVALVEWRRRRVPTALWLVLAFGDLALITSVGRFVPSHPHSHVALMAQRVLIVALVLFPYFLYRFATGFTPPSRCLLGVVNGGVLVVVVWTVALRHFPQTGEPRPTGFILYVVGLVAEWAVLTALVAVRLWRAGTEQPSVARGRMRLLASASALITLALLVVAFEKSDYTTTALVSQILAILGGIAFLLAIAPPPGMRAIWRLPEQLRLQEAVQSLMTVATTRAEVAERVLGPTVAILGARGAAVVEGGEVLATTGEIPVDLRPSLSGADDALMFEAGDATLLVWTSPYAPFFGREEVGLLETLAALAGIALDRVRLYEQEHDARVALERSNEVMADFIALAAHELRTPVTTIHGFVATLNHLGERLSLDQQRELSTVLEQQTTRLASLVEQLLDLSRLDARAIEVRPQVVRLRHRLDEIAASAAAGREGELVVDVPADLDVVVDPAIVDRVVTNLLTNAFRYGRPPIRIQAERQNGSVYIAVEDEGPGVAREVESALFERFTRAGVARDRVAGTGLGLAIAQAYAHAHDGDLSYEPRSPCGARFVLRLPAEHPQPLS